MRSLLDINVLIALLDSDHVSHHTAREWFSLHATDGWASCPLTQNGCMRIMSHPNYPNPIPISRIRERLSEAASSSLHQFWPDDVSFLDAGVADTARIHGPHQITDLYLLALAIRHKGRFVTFDGSIVTSAVQGFEGHHLVVL
ncbi:TA system VapC family ribonuclease toxin [Leptospirillum ferriphilum]|uniref:Ribonuclease VapC n=1 Tax=Leptospirillum ferriphilum (strain ML-04) TaxID=1048260 RepID=J9ZDJ7_LEPFM|nr:TA system VapC family ribonuclease toxin [Leptospirillum ferriphilum]AFS53903.1 hypothetical protein LFML04_1701 [Leptospirillum ferriphilum ML-04]